MDGNAICSKVTGPEDWIKEESENANLNGQVLASECLSPIFRTNTNRMTSTLEHNKNQLPDSSEDEIPSYQVNQSLKNNPSLSNTEDDDSNEHCHVYSPPTSLNKSARISRIASAHTLGTIRKSLKGSDSVNDFLKPCAPPQTPNLAVPTTELNENKNIFDTLGALDKDISWVSSMASPSPCLVGFNEFNTIEKATFFPEEEFRCVQPRALFSPSLDEDFGFKPLNFSSESEDDASSYRSKMRLSDVCDVLKDLFVNSRENHVEAIPEVEKLEEKEQPSSTVIEEVPCHKPSTSPILKIRRRKRPDLLKKKKKGLLIKSPPLNLKVCEESRVAKENNSSEKISEENSVKNDILPTDLCIPIHDDSFQNMSFSSIDELCRVSIVDNSSFTSISKPVEFTTQRNDIQKICYDDDKSGLVFQVTVNEEKFKSSKLLEEGDLDNCKKTEVDKTLFSKKGFVPFHQCESEPEKIHLKRQRSEEKNGEKKKRKVLKYTEKDPVKKDVKNEKCEIVETKSEFSEWSSKHSFLESDLDLTETQMYKTLEDIEKMMEVSKNDSAIRINCDEVTEFSVNCKEKASANKNDDSLRNTESKVAPVTLASTQKLLTEFNTLGESPKNEFEKFGFKTAGGLKIAVSKKALQRAKTMLESVNEDFNSETCDLKLESASTEGNSTNILNVKVSGFSAVSDKSAKVFEKSVVKIESNIKGIENEKENFFAELKESKEYDFITTPSVSGFSTASGKKVTVSNKAFAQAKKILEAVDCEINSNIKGKESEGKGNVTTYGQEELIFHEKLKMGNEVDTVSFRIAVGKDISISEKALDSAKEFEGQENIHLSNEQKGSSATTEKSVVKMDRDSISSYVGFTTAGGKKVNVSENALARARKLLETKEMDEELTLEGDLNFKSHVTVNEKMYNIEKKPPENLLLTEEKFNSEKSLNKPVKKDEPTKLLPSVDIDKISEIDNQKAIGFTTANGKNIRISEKSLSKAKHILEGVENDIDSEYPVSHKIDNFIGFATASGKKVNISKKAFDRAKNLLETEEEVQNHSRGKCKIESGFATVSGKNVNISEEASLGSKNFLGSSENIIDKSNYYQEGKTNLNIGFATASGKQVQISKRALVRARRMLEDEECNEDLKIEKQPVKKEDDTSEAVLTKTNTDLQSGEKSTDMYILKKARGSNVGFATASGKEVHVSKKALDKARKFLEAEENQESTDVKEISEMGLTTASRKSVKVSKSSVLKPHNLLETHESLLDSAEKLKENLSALGGNNSKILFAPHAPGKSSSVSEKLVKDNEEMKKLKNSSEMSESISEPLNDSPKLKTYVNEKSSLFEDNEWDDNIPSWLHTYSTSPSFLADRTELSSIISHEDGETYYKQPENFVTSPILGNNDRFFKRQPGKRKPRKLDFEQRKIPSNENGGSSKSSFNVPYKVKRGEKRNSSNLFLDFSAPFKKMKMERIDEVEDFENLTLEVLEGRKKAREEQESLTKGKIKPVKGSHFKKKCNEPQKKWSEVIGNELPQVYDKEDLLKMHIKEAIIDVNINNAAEFKFNAVDFFSPSICFSNISGIPVGDGALLILDDENHAGIEEFTRAFMASPGVEPNLISKPWVANHYKWIVWKLAHYETSFPKHFGNRSLTPHHVMLQLKYRYDREIDLNERSALKKILEKDDSSAKRMILCVFSIKKIITSDKNGETVGSMSCYELGLTDGWYGCAFRTDSAMARFIESGKIRIGTKLMTSGAELINCDQGVSPLEISEAIYLKISTNSTRRARWDSKLGFQRDHRFIPVSLNSILPGGGLVSRVDVIVARVYPLVFLEKFADGRKVIRNGRAENKAAAVFQLEQEVRIEKIYGEIQAEQFKISNTSGKKGKKKLTSTPLSQVTSGEDLCALLDTSSDPISFQSLLTEAQKQSMLNFKQQCIELKNRELSEKLQEKLKGEKLNKRNVTEVLRIKVIEYRNPNKKAGLVSLWKPTEDLISFFSEGKAVSLLNVSADNTFFQMVRLNANRQTQYKEIASLVDFPARKTVSMDTLSSEPPFHEVDFVGIVVMVHETSYGSSSLKTVYLADSHSNFIGIPLWANTKELGWEDVLNLKSIIAGSNLQWKKSNLQFVPCVHVNEYTIFTENPRLPHLKKGLEDLRKALPKDLDSFITQCQEDLRSKLDEEKCQSNRSTYSSSISPNIGNLNYSKPKYVNGFAARPNASSTPVKSSSHILESNSNDPSPIQKKIEKLQSYGEPPPLSPLVLLSNNRLRNKFKAPVKSESPPMDT